MANQCLNGRRADFEVALETDRPRTNLEGPVGKGLAAGQVKSGVPGAGQRQGQQQGEGQARGDGGIQPGLRGEDRSGAHLKLMRVNYRVGAWLPSGPESPLP